MNMLRKPPAAYDQINRLACPYPAYMLPRGGTGLCLFAAGFYGQNDVIHMARKQMTVTCVDRDTDKLFTMAELYPQGWRFEADDVWDFSERAVLRGDRYDAVSVDPFFGDAAEKAADTLYLWTSLARNLVTLTVSVHTRLNTPVGWEVDYFPRSDRAAWMVLRR